MTTGTIDTIVKHASVRRFRTDPLPDSFIDLLKEAMRRGPTSSALQTYTIIFVQDPATKEALQKHAGNQSYIGACPLFLVSCADLRRIRKVTDERGYPYRAHDLRILISAVEDLTIATQNASLAAQSLGLGTVMIGGVLNGLREIHELLELPPRVVPIVGLCVGYPAPEEQDIAPRPRLPKEVVFHHDRYTLSEDCEHRLLAQHDAEVTDLGYYQGRAIPFETIYPESEHDPIAPHNYGWTEHIARKGSRHWWLHASSKLFHDLHAVGLDLEPPEPTETEN